MNLLLQRPFCLVLLSVAASLGLPASGAASSIPIAVQNGGFEALTAPGVSAQLNSHTTSSDSSPIQNASGWTSGNSGTVAGFNFVFTSSTTASNGAYGMAYGRQYGGLSLWGMTASGANGIGPSPAGGNFLAMDGAFEQATVSQQLTGLTVGMNTRVSFYYAGAQQFNFTGPTTEGFQVGLTDDAGHTTETHTTAILNDASHGFTGWQYTTLDFMPTNTTETLSFLAVGTPGGEPPFSLLDGVTVVQVTPEPSSLMLLGTGALLMGCYVLRRRFARS